MPLATNSAASSEPNPDYASSRSAWNASWSRCSSLRLFVTRDADPDKEEFAVSAHLSPGTGTRVRLS